jgi:hypothetical protein
MKDVQATGEAFSPHEIALLDSDPFRIQIQPGSEFTTLGPYTINLGLFI